MNVCGHPRIDPVCGANLVPVTEEHLDTWGLGNARVPVLVGPTRLMLDSDGHDATAVDVLFHPGVVRRALLGGKSVTKEHFRDYLMDIAEKNIQEDHGISCAPGRRVVLEVAKYKGPNGEHKDKTHEFPVFVDREEDRDEKIDSSSKETKDTTTSADEKSEKNAPRTETGNASTSKNNQKPIKKGFLSSSGRGDTSLYPNGSAEGIRKPGEEYDPLGHIPENVRKNCHVIDSGALRGADFERVTKQYAETGRLDTCAPGVYAKGSEPGKKKEVGIGHPNEKPLAQTSSSSKPKSTGKQKLTPEYSTATNDTSVQLVINLDQLTNGMQCVELDTSETSLSLVSPEYSLTVTLPKKVNPDGTTAKFSSKQKTLTVLLPLER